MVCVINPRLRLESTFSWVACLVSPQLTGGISTAITATDTILINQLSRLYDLIISLLGISHLIITT